MPLGLVLYRRHFLATGHPIIESYSLPEPEECSI